MARIGFVIGILLGLSATGLPAAAQHPAEGHPPLFPLALVYQADHPLAEHSRGDLTFSLGRTPLEQLSPLEVYMLAGAAASQLPDGRMLEPWKNQVMSCVMAYYREWGSVPPVLNEERIRSLPGYAGLSEQELDLYRNPLTAAWPRLDAAQPSPGDLYIRPLSDSEVQELAVLLGKAAVWLSPGSGVAGAGSAPERLSGPVFYQRLYGWQGPIYEALPFATTPR